MPEVSIITPTFERLPLLKQAIASVRAQHYGDWELVIVDDGSGDGTGDYVARLGDPRCRLVTLPHGGNVARARNAGLQVARGPFIAFLDSDDLWLPGKLAVQLAAMQKAGVRWSYTGYELVDLEGNRVPFRAGSWTPLEGRIAAQVLTLAANVAISTLLVERSLLESIGQFSEDPAVNLREDYELVLRLAVAAEVGVVDDALVQVREHAGRSTSAIADGFDRSAHVYDVFARNCRDPGLARLARRRRGHDLAEAAARRLSSGAYASAGRFYLASLRSGDSIRHWLSAVRRGLSGAVARTFRS